MKDLVDGKKLFSQSLGLSIKLLKEVYLNHNALEYSRNKISGFETLKFYKKYFSIYKESSYLCQGVIKLSESQLF